MSLTLGLGANDASEFQAAGTPALIGDCCDALEASKRAKRSKRKSENASEERMMVIVIDIPLLWLVDQDHNQKVATSFRLLFENLLNLAEFKGGAIITDSESLKYHLEYCSIIEFMLFWSSAFRMNEIFRY